MDKAVQDRILDRLAGLVGQDDEDRMQQYLEKLERRAKAQAEAQARLRERKQAEGMRRVQAYISLEHYSALCKHYPGPRGGIDWERLADAALRAKADL